MFMREFLNTTSAERAQTVRECQEKIGELESEIDVLNTESSKLKEVNAEKIRRKDTVTKQIHSTKMKGNFLIGLGVVIAAGAFLFLQADTQSVLRIIGLVLGVAVFVLGVVVRSGWKKYETESREASFALIEYDAEQAKYNRQISTLSGKINDYQSLITRIRRFEANEDFYRFAYTTDTGHVFVFVTSEMHLLDSTPRQPQSGKAYTTSTIKECDLYLDDMVYDSGKKISAQKQYGRGYHVEVVDGGTHKLQLRAIINPANSIHKIESKPIPCRPATKSTFVWWHLSTCQEGTYNYINEYDSLEAFAEAINLSKPEIMNYLH